MAEKIYAKLQTIAENVQKVYDSGYNSGYNSGYDTGHGTGYDEGTYAERKAMWDVLQQKGKRTDYNAMFAYSKYGSKNFYPQYDIKPTTIANWFYSANNPDYCGVLNFGERLRECGITLDTSNCTNFRYAFSSATNLRGDFGTLDIRKNTDVTGIIGTAGSSAVNNNTIKFIIDESTNLKDLFVSTGNRHWIITFEGTIGQSLNISSTNRLDTESAKTIIETNLKNLVGTDLEGTLSFKLHSDVWAKLDTTYPREDGSTWQDYVTTGLGWTT